MDNLTPFYQSRHGDIFQGDALAVLRKLPPESVHCCVTSPPYWGLRDYGVKGQIGLEKTPEQYVDCIAEVFAEVWRVLRKDATLWLNLGDCYSQSWGKKGKSDWAGKTQKGNLANIHVPTRQVENLGAKNLVGIPWRVAFALQEMGWILRQEIIWNKPNPMPESVKDRFTNAHERIFLLTKSPKYFFDQTATLEPCSPNTHARFSQDIVNQAGSIRANGGTRMDRPMKPVGRRFDPFRGNKNNESFDTAMVIVPEKRNKRSVWTVTTKGFKGAHFATFPPDLIEPCILAGCPMGGTVLDPFFGSGTVGQVAGMLRRRWIGIELKPEYCRELAVYRVENRALPKKPSKDDHRLSLFESGAI